MNVRNSVAAAAIMLALGIPSAASADVIWNVSGTMSDQTTFSGWFSLDIYGDITGFDLTTQAQDPFTGFEYLPSDVYGPEAGPFPTPPTYWVGFTDYYHHTLRLQFANDLNNGAGTDPLVTGLLGPSWECQDSYQCNLTTGDAVAEDLRWVVNGQATSGNANNIPEPLTLSLFGAGLFAAAGLRRRKAAKAG